MISFLYGIFQEQANKILKIKSLINASAINQNIDDAFLRETYQLIQNIEQRINGILMSGDLDLDYLLQNNLINYSQIFEELSYIEENQLDIIVNYGKAEGYFNRKILQIYKELNCTQAKPLLTTISSSRRYYWANTKNNVIALPFGEEKSLLNLPDLYHEIGHLIYAQSPLFLTEKNRQAIEDYYTREIAHLTGGPGDQTLIASMDKVKNNWLNTWIVEFCCDLIATYFTGPAYAWTHFKHSAISMRHNRLFEGSQIHPPDEARMRGICSLLNQSGHSSDATSIQQSWQQVLTLMSNTTPVGYAQFFPQHLIDQLAGEVIFVCQQSRLRSYEEQVRKFKLPVSKILNDAWTEVFKNYSGFRNWEEVSIASFTTQFLFP